MRSSGERSPRSLFSFHILCRLLLSTALVSCTAEIGEFEDHSEQEDFTSSQSAVPGLPGRFNPNNLVSDALFTDQSLSANEIQHFLEEAPYQGGMRSWLADEEVNGILASQAIVNAATSQNINPLFLLTRMQVEKSSVSRVSRPSRQKDIDFIMGCGCYDNRPCMESYRGFDKQMECAAETLRKHYDNSIAGSGAWRMGRSKRSLDGISVTPSNHATASLYAYTPWVLRGTGGAWLVWNITKKYANTLKEQLDAPGAADGEASDDQSTPWIGDSCQSNSQCNMDSLGASGGKCNSWFDEDAGQLAGFCTRYCEGFCPDRFGRAETMCADIQGESQCVSVAGENDRNCSQLPGTVLRAVPRFVGQSGLPEIWRNVCVPPTEETSCNLDERAGYCLNVTEHSCAGEVVSGACPGSSAIRCCIED